MIQHMVHETGLVIQNTLYECIHIYGISVSALLSNRIQYLSLSGDTEVNIANLFSIREWFTFMSVFHEADINNRLQCGESRSCEKGQQGQGWCFQLPFTDNLYLVFGICRCFTVNFGEVLLTARGTRFEILRMFQIKFSKSIGTFLEWMCTAFPHELEICWHNTYWCKYLSEMCCFLKLLPFVSSL